MVLCEKADLPPAVVGCDVQCWLGFGLAELLIRAF